MKYPVFGEKIAHKDYVSRYAVYIIVENKHTNEIAMIQAPNGAFFLPGGEIEEQETKEDALKREMIEELGITIMIDYSIGEAADYFYSRHRDTYFYNPAYFYVAKEWKKVCEPTEETNNVVWEKPKEVIQALKRGSHKWAVQQWLKQKNIEK